MPDFDLGIFTPVGYAPELRTVEGDTKLWQRETYDTGCIFLDDMSLTRTQRPGEVTFYPALLGCTLGGENTLGLETTEPIPPDHERTYTHIDTDGVLVKVAHFGAGEEPGLGVLNIRYTKLLDESVRVETAPLAVASYAYNVWGKPIRWLSKSATIEEPAEYETRMQEIIRGAINEHRKNGVIEMTDQNAGELTERMVTLFLRELPPELIEHYKARSLAILPEDDAAAKPDPELEAMKAEALAF